MPCLRFDPHSKTITNVEPDGDFLEFLREQMNCTHIESVMMAPHLALWVDAFGLYRKDQKYWQFDAEAQRICGIGIVTAVTEEGFPAPLNPDMSPELFLEHVYWVDATLESIGSTIKPTPTEHGLWPKVVVTSTGVRRRECPLKPKPWREP